MGYINHKTIIVTAFNKENINTAYNKATALFPELVTNLLQSPINGYFTFFIGPDGSKEGWDHSEEYDALYLNFLEWANDESNLKYSLDVFCLRYGGDEDDVHRVKISELDEE